MDQELKSRDVSTPLDMTFALIRGLSYSLRSTPVDCFQIADAAVTEMMRFPARLGSGTVNDKSDPDGQLFVSIRVYLWLALLLVGGNLR